MRDALAYALGVAISPVAIAALLLLLTSRRAAANGTSFAVGWAAGVAALVALSTVVVRELGVTNDHPVWVGVLELIIGLAFLVAAAVLFRRREGREARSASVVTAVETLTPVHAAGLGIVLSGANPKVIALALGAAISLAEVDATPETTAEAVVLFTAIGVAGVALPLAAYVALPSRSRSLLARARVAVIRHETAVLIVLGLAIGTAFLVDGLRSLG